MTNRFAVWGGLFAVFAVAAGVRGQEPKPRPPAFDEKQLADPKTAAAAADLLEASYLGEQPPEGVRMLLAILRGSRMGAGEGWFGPAQTRYTWEWLAGLHGVDAKTGTIPRKSFRGSETLFDRLDRDRDGELSADDIDWSDNSKFARETALARTWFRKMNTAGDGKLTKKELEEFFDKAAAGKSALTQDEFRDALMDGGSRGVQRGGGARRTPDAMRATLLRGLFAGEIGSMNEGPKIGQPAPNFALRTFDGKETVQLAKLIGAKPVVLVFGNYTCGPFCNSYPAVEPIYKRFMNDATFLMVYVREAHPSDGWSMGADVKQPKSFDERVAVAGQFVKRATPTIPVLVDEINDPAGHAYSGMPSRLYVIDPQGVVAYKSGRGPFGFRPAEMEQALAMCLLEQQAASAPARTR
jgi:Iodothyronine deiodinase